MNKILIFGYYRIPDSTDVIACATSGLNENNKIILLTNHICSDESYIKHDMGITSNLKHDVYDKIYPNGYELEYLGCFQQLDDKFINLIKDKSTS